MEGKMSFKVWRVVMVVLVLGVAANQGASPQTPTCTKFSAPVLVQISTSADGTAAVDKDPACVAKGGKMSWTATDGDSWSTDFVDDPHSPFAAGKKHHGGKVNQVRGDQVRACSVSDPNYSPTAGGCAFKYNATHKKGGKTATKDPQVVIQPGS